MTIRWVTALVLIITAAYAAPTKHPTAPQAPEIKSLLKPSIYDRAIKEREIMTHASLDDKHYSYYSTMTVRATTDQARAILTNYSLYSKMISYVDKAEYDENTHELAIEGGVWGWKMRSWIKFEERGKNWIHYTFVRGHFTGMAGDILFESEGEKGTLIYMGGEQTQEEWPPKFVLERGAEIVFGFTGNRMRSYIEEHKTEGKAEPHDQNVPQPRSRL